MKLVEPMFLSKKTILALSVMIDIAQNAEERPISAKDLAERHHVSPRFFEVMLKNLAAKGLIRGQRGPKGGYTLGRDMRSIRVGDVVTSVGPADEDDVSLPEVAQRALSAYVDNINAAILAKLNECTLADLIARKTAQSWSSPSALAC